MELNKYSRAFGVAFLGLVGSFQVNAQISPATAGELGKWWQASTSGFQTVPSGSPASFAVATIPPPATVPAGSVGVKAFEGQWPSAAARSQPRGIPGSPVIDVFAKVKSPSVVKAVGRVFASVSGPIGVGFAIFDLAKEIGFTLGSNSTGINSVTFSDPSICTTAPCVQYQFRTSAPASTFSQACQNGLGQGQSTGYGYMVYTRVIASASYGCNMESTNANGSFDLGWQTLASIESAPAASNEVASTRADFEAAVAAKSGWPAASAISRVVADAIKSGEVIETEPATVTGPATSTPKVTTVQKPDGTTEKTSTTNNYSYAGNNVSVTTVSNVENYNPTTNVTTNQISTTSSAGEAPQPSACETNPKSIGCSDIDVPEGVIPKVSKDVTYSAETMFSGGSCPADVSIAQHLTGRAVVLSYTPTCNALANYVKPIIIAIALFMAYLIILPGRTE